MKTKVAIVTGGARGIGLGAAKNLVQRGYKVAICSRHEKDVNAGVKALKKEMAKVKGFAKLKKSDDCVLGLLVDVSKEAEWKKLVGEVVKKWGRIDALVNNAGVLLEKDLLSMTYEEMDDILHVNLFSAWIGMKAVVPFMKKQGGGRIVNLASIAGLRGYAGLGAYCMSKFGVVGLTKVAAKEFAGFGVRVNAVCPGLVDTEMTKNWMENKKILGPLVSEIPMGRAGKPDEIGAVIGFLADEESSFVTGTTYTVDGGNLA